MIRTTAKQRQRTMELVDAGEQKTLPLSPAPQTPKAERAAKGASGAQRGLSLPNQPPECLRCGQCCHFIEAGKVVACRFLYKANFRFGPITIERMGCSVYSTRHHYKPIPGLDKYCIDRKDSAYDFPGCPYNTNKPLFQGTAPKAVNKSVK